MPNKLQKEIDCLKKELEILEDYKDEYKSIYEGHKELLKVYEKKTRSGKNYGEVARSNGLKFEEKICSYYNKPENFSSIFKKMKEIYPNIDCEGKFIKCDAKKVVSKHSKKTTRKTDIWYITPKVKVPFSVKMSNKGSQLQIISLNIFLLFLESVGVKMNEKTKSYFEKFLGLQTPSIGELQKFNKKRTKRNKNKQRYLMNELEKEGKDRIVNFLKTHYDKIIELIFFSGLCVDDDDKAEMFIFNNSYYTKTKEIKPFLFNSQEIKKKYKENVKITNLGSLELNKKIGLQMKGSSKGASYHYLQFTLRCDNYE